MNWIFKIQQEKLTTFAKDPSCELQLRSYKDYYEHFIGFAEDIYKGCKNNGVVGQQPQQQPQRWVQLLCRPVEWFKTTPSTATALPPPTRRRRTPTIAAHLKPSSSPTINAVPSGAECIIRDVPAAALSTEILFYFYFMFFCSFYPHRFSIYSHQKTMFNQFLSRKQGPRLLSKPPPYKEIPKMLYIPTHIYDYDDTDNNWLDFQFCFLLPTI